MTCSRTCPELLSIFGSRGCGISAYSTNGGPCAPLVDLSRRSAVCCRSHCVVAPRSSLSAKPHFRCAPSRLMNQYAFRSSWTKSSKSSLQRQTFAINDHLNRSTGPSLKGRRHPSAIQFPRDYKHICAPEAHKSPDPSVRLTW